MPKGISKGISPRLCINPNHLKAHHDPNCQGMTFYPSQIGQLFCCRKCHWNFVNRKRWQRTKIPLSLRKCAYKKCPYPNKMFMPKSRKQKYHPSCANLRRREQQKAWRKSYTQHWARVKTGFVCPNCKKKGTLFKVSFIPKSPKVKQKRPSYYSVRHVISHHIKGYTTP